MDEGSLWWDGGPDRIRTCDPQIRNLMLYSVSDDLAQQETIIQSVIYMSSTAVLWWFGDRAMRPKK